MTLRIALVSLGSLLAACIWFPDLLFVNALDTDAIVAAGGGCRGREVIVPPRGSAWITSAALPLAPRDQAPAVASGP